MRHRFSEEGLHDLQDLGPSARGLVRHVGRGGGAPPGVSHGGTEPKVGPLNRNRGGTHALSCLGIDPVP
jgi:hypothetical protein